MLNIEFLCDSPIPLLGVYSREIKIYVHKSKNAHSRFIHSQNAEIPKCPCTGESRNKIGVVIQ